MGRISQDFVSSEDRTYTFKLGRQIASALSGFIVGVVVSSVIWMLAIWYMNNIILEGIDTGTASIISVILENI